MNRQKIFTNSASKQAGSNEKPSEAAAEAHKEVNNTLELAMTTSRSRSYVDLVMCHECSFIQFFQRCDSLFSNYVLW